MTMQGPLTQWVTDHRKHHALSDQPGDPHSPHVGHGDGAWGAVRGLRPRARRLALHEPRHGAGPRVREGSLRGPARAHDRPALRRSGSSLTLGIPFLIGYAIGGTVGAGLEALVWGGLIRIFLYQHATFSVNSICHMFGRKDYRSRDEARNNWIVALLVFGEGWHNNHHAFPASARHGLRPLAGRRLLVGDPQPGEAPSRLGREGAGRRAARSPSRSIGVGLKARELGGHAAGPTTALRAAAAPAAPRGTRFRAALPGSACSRPRRRAPGRGRSRAGRARGLTPGIPGSQRSSRPWMTASRRPRNGSSDRRSGNHGARPTTVSTDGSTAACTATAPPIEKPSSKVRGAPASTTAARASATHQSSRFHDLIRYRTSAKPSSGKAGASRRTSHSSDALQVPSTSLPWPPFTHTTARRAVGPVTRSSAPVDSCSKEGARVSAGRRGRTSAPRARPRPSCS